MITSVPTESGGQPRNVMRCRCELNEHAYGEGDKRSYLERHCTGLKVPSFAQEVCTSVHLAAGEVDIRSDQLCSEWILEVACCCGETEERECIKVCR